MEGFFDDLVDRFKKNGRIEEMRQIARANKFKFKDREKFANQNYLIKSYNSLKMGFDNSISSICKSLKIFSKTTSSDFTGTSFSL